jgi:acetyl-CoA synthetase
MPAKRAGVAHKEEVAAMTEEAVINVPAGWAKKAWVDNDKYLAMYQRSLDDPEGFWREHGQRIHWTKPFTKVKNTNYRDGVSIKWFEDGELNVSANCLDRHLSRRANQTAIIWEADDPKEDARYITYREAYEEVCRMANALKLMGAKTGDRITIYMPMIPEAAYAMLACARIGAIHSVVFGGFSPDSLANRIQDCDSNIVITADEGLRGGRKVPMSTRR